MAYKKSGGFQIIMFIFEAALLSGVLILLLLSGPKGAAEINGPGNTQQVLENTPEPSERAVLEQYRDAAGALIVLDASGIDDGGYFEELAGSINEANNEKGQYIKCEPGKLTETYDELVSEGTKPTVVMGPDGLIANLKGLADISGVYGQLYFNEAADRCITKCTLPLALRMYGYYFRMDIMHDMRVYVPRSYIQISEASAVIMQKNPELMAFAFEPEGEGCQLMLQQMAGSEGANINDYINMLSGMRGQGMLLEDIEGGSTLAGALCEGSAVMGFDSGNLYAQLINDKSMRELVQVKPYLGNDASYTASVISCAIVSGAGFDAAQSYLIKLFREGIDEIIVKRNPGFVNPGMEYSLDSPWSGVLTDGGSLIILNENMLYSGALMSAFGAGGDSTGGGG